MTYVMEGQLKGMIEEADKEKTLKQVSKASLYKKNLGAERSGAVSNYHQEGMGASQAKSRGFSREIRGGRS